MAIARFCLISVLQTLAFKLKYQNVRSLKFKLSSKVKIIVTDLDLVRIYLCGVLHLGILEPTVDVRVDLGKHLIKSLISNIGFKLAQSYIERFKSPD